MSTQLAVAPGRRDRPGTPIVRVRDITKTFPTSDGEGLRVLANVSLEVRAGEILALLGKSGSGKSTLLRTIAGLIAPSSGEVLYRDAALNGANPGVAMVFQTFALFPWLTVQQNVELGLQARAVPEAERTIRALRAIDLIGLDGFESAYPKELSGGMRQRVGFARALVVEPDVLLMDEPFSALDVLTAENLRSELLKLWDGHEFPTEAVLIVTHNIEEAILLADRVLVLASNPGHIRAELTVDLPRPRDRHSAGFEDLVDEIYGILTGRDDVGEERPQAGEPEPVRVLSPTEAPLPAASVGGISGLLEIVSARGGREDLPELASVLSFDVDDLLPIIDAAVMLGLATVDNADLELTDAGREFAAADILASKKIFADLAVRRAPLVRAIHRALAATADGTLRRRFFLDLLRGTLGEEEARRQLDTAIDWGRYAELFDLDHDTGTLKIEAPESEAEKAERAAT